MKRFAMTAGLLGLVVSGSLSLSGAQEKAPGPPAPGTPITITLGPRQARATPQRVGFTHTGGGNIDVAQPAVDTVVVTFTGVAVAGAHPCKDSAASLNFDLSQCFDLAFDEKVTFKQAKLTLEGRVIGLLRSHSRGGGSAREGPGTAAVSSGPAGVAALTLPPHAVAGGENESINDREGPVSAPVVPARYTLHMAWTVGAAHPHNLRFCKAASAEFAPDPALDPLWISYWEPFHGAAKKDFGFQVTLKVSPP